MNVFFVFFGGAGGGEGGGCVRVDRVSEILVIEELGFRAWGNGCLVTWHLLGLGVWGALDFRCRVSEASLTMGFLAVKTGKGGLWRDWGLGLRATVSVRWSDLVIHLQP